MTRFRAELDRTFCNTKSRWCPRAHHTPYGTARDMSLNCFVNLPLRGTLNSHLKIKPTTLLSGIKQQSWEKQAGKTQSASII